MAFTLVSAPPLMRMGVPPDVALLIGGGFVAVAVRLGYLLYLGRQRSGRFSLAGVVSYQERIPARRFAALFGLAVVYGLGLYFLLSPFSHFLAAHVFGWLPGYLLPSWDPVHAGYGRAVLLGWAVALLVLDGVVTPIAEELYFRGNLLPRMVPTLGRMAPVVSAAGFALQHFWQPYNAPFLFLFWLTFGPIVMRTRCLRLGIAVHITSNVLGAVLVLASILSS
jgi:membrane protease YdiL (CAAX protease family)